MKELHTSTVGQLCLLRSGPIHYHSSVTLFKNWLVLGTTLFLSTGTKMAMIRWEIIKMMKELDENIPIASLTFGAERDFIFKHENKKTMNIEDIKIVLKDGMLLLMHHPTNSYWYHGLPQRKKCLEPRINLTFRKIKM